MLMILKVTRIRVYTSTNLNKTNIICLFPLGWFIILDRASNVGVEFWVLRKPLLGNYVISPKKIYLLSLFHKRGRPSLGS